LINGGNNALAAETVRSCSDQGRILQINKPGSFDNPAFTDVKTWDYSFGEHD